MKNIILSVLILTVISCKNNYLESSNNSYTTPPEIGRLTTDLPKYKNAHNTQIKPINPEKKQEDKVIEEKIIEEIKPEKEVVEDILKNSIIQSVDSGFFADKAGERITQILDVRTLEEYYEGHIYDAVNIDVQDSAAFVKQIKKLDKDRPVAVYCRSGVRSIKAGKILEKNGFKVIYNLNGGIKQWTKDGKKLEK